MFSPCFLAIFIHLCIRYVRNQVRQDSEDGVFRHNQLPMPLLLADYSPVFYFKLIRIRLDLMSGIYCKGRNCAIKHDDCVDLHATHFMRLNSLLLMELRTLSCYGTAAKDDFHHPIMCACDYFWWNISLEYAYTSPGLNKFDFILKYPSLKSLSKSWSE